MIQNIVIGKPLVEPWSLISYNKKDFEKNDKEYTMFTEERFLPTLLVNAGIVKSKSEIKRNRVMVRGFSIGGRFNYKLLITNYLVYSFW
jgi:dienelactone hydrolase